MPIRVCVIHGIVPHYRVPLFDRLACTPEIELEVWGHLGPTKSSLRSAAERGSFRAVNAPERSIGPFLWQPGQLAAARSGRFDVIVFAWNQRYLHLKSALRTAQARGVGTCVWGHGYSKHDSRLRRLRRNALLRHCDACLLYGDAAKAALVREGIDESMIFVARNALDQTPIVQATAAWTEPPGRLEEFQRQHGLSNAKVIIHIARVEPEKRVELLIEAAARLRPRFPTLRLVVIGEGSSVPAVKAAASRLGMSDLLRMPGALYDEADIAPWCLSAHMAVYPAAIGLSLLHDLGYGLPVVTSDRIGGHGPEVAALEDGRNGLFFRHESAEDLAVKMARLLEDTPRREAMSAAARATVHGPEGFTLDNMLVGMLSAIRRCAEAAAQRRRR